MGKCRDYEMNFFNTVTIMIATFNSEKLLPRTLDAIKRQTYPAELIEILVIDGGSSDKTKEIAQKYGCRILNNPKKEPVNAKLIGMREAKGKYLVTIDHDEVLQNVKSIENKVKLLQENPECKVAFCSGYLCPEDYPKLNQYISEYGDPFSLFVYRFSKGYHSMERVLRKNYLIEKENEEGIVVSFEKMKKQPLFELCCAGTMIDREYFFEFEGVCYEGSVFVHLFYLMLEQGKRKVVFTKNDPLVHYSADSLKNYLPKIKWRICNNIHFSEMGKSGFNGRVTYSKSIQKRKYLFIPYTILCLPNLLEACYLAVDRKNPIFLFHPIFCWYTLIQIICQYALKVVGKKPLMTSYDGKEVIKE